MDGGHPLQIEYRPIGDLIPYARNARTHDEAQVALVAQAEREAISRRTKKALAVAKARGVKLGNPNGAEALRRAGKGGVALRATVRANAHQHAADLAEVVAEIRAAGATGLREMAEAVTAWGMMTRRGGAWRVSSVRNLVRRLG